MLSISPIYSKAPLLRTAYQVDALVHVSALTMKEEPFKIKRQTAYRGTCPLRVWYELRIPSFLCT